MIQATNNLLRATGEFCNKTRSLKAFTNDFSQENLLPATLCRLGIGEEHNLHHPEGPITLRAGTDDLPIWREIFSNPEMYRIPEYYLDDLHSHSKVTLVDLGANIGLATRKIYHQLISSDIYPPRITLIAVEPDQMNFHYLQRNTKGLNDSNKYLFQRAVSSETGQNIIINNGPQGDFAWLQTQPTEHDSQIKSICMKDLLEFTPEPDLLTIKIDIEGAERFIARGNLDWLNLTDILFIETHNHLIQGSFTDLELAIKESGLELSGQLGYDLTFTRR